MATKWLTDVNGKILVDSNGKPLSVDVSGGGATVVTGSIVVTSEVKTLTIAGVPTIPKYIALRCTTEEKLQLNYIEFPCVGGTESQSFMVYQSSSNRYFRVANANTLTVVNGNLEIYSLQQSFGYMNFAYSWAYQYIL